MIAHFIQEFYGKDILCYCQILVREKRFKTNEGEGIMVNSPTDQLANAKTSASWSSIQYNLLEGKHTEKQTIFSKKTLVNIGEHLTEAETLVNIGEHHQ